MDFNESTEKPEFMSKADPQNEKRFEIYRFKPYKGPKGDYDMVGDYIVVDAEETAELTEKKLENLIKLLNGKKNLESLQNLTKMRLLYNIKLRTSDTEPTVIEFRTHDGAGVSTENAVLTLEKGVYDERR